MVGPYCRRADKIAEILPIQRISTNQSVNQSISLSIDQSIKQSINQLINQSINQIIKQSFHVEGFELILIHQNIKTGQGTREHSSYP